MSKKIPMRMCVGCGEMKPKKEMMRVVRTPEDTFILDVTGKKNGRGAYLCKNALCLEKAVRSRGLERSFQVHIPEEIMESLTKEFNHIETE